MVKVKLCPSNPSTVTIKAVRTETKRNRRLTRARRILLDLTDITSRASLLERTEAHPVRARAQDPNHTNTGCGAVRDAVEHSGTSLVVFFERSVRFTQFFSDRLETLAAARSWFVPRLSSVRERGTNVQPLPPMPRAAVCLGTWG